MSKRSVHLLLEDMVEAAGRIERYTTGMDKDAFVSDLKTSDAVVRNLEIIGEAANRLPDAFRRAHQEVEWHKIVGLRHRIVHDYFGVDLALVWEIAQRNIPEFMDQVFRIRETIVDSDSAIED